MHWEEQHEPDHAYIMYFCHVPPYTARVFPWMAGLWTAHIRGSGHFGYQQFFATRGEAQAWAERHLTTLTEDPPANERIAVRQESTQNQASSGEV